MPVHVDLFLQNVSSGLLCLSLLKINDAGDDSQASLICPSSQFNLSGGVSSSTRPAACRCSDQKQNENL